MSKVGESRGWHSLGMILDAYVHDQPVSLIHFEEQPSESLKFPSSHSSGRITNPSPQIGEQRDFS